MTSTKPLLLLTNDDGINSPGLLAIIKAVHDLGEILVVAPATQQTGMGRGQLQVTGDGAVIEKTVQINPDQTIPAYAVPGSPAQAVVLGIQSLAPRRPDLVISGINYGENVGNLVTSSGTVGAALEAATVGIRGLAVSLETDKAYHYAHGNDVNWDTAAAFARYFADAMLRLNLPFDVDILKVDVPAEATPKTPWRVTRQSRQPYFESFAPAKEQRPALAHMDYHVQIAWDTLEPDSDIHAFTKDRVVSVTPLSIDLTSRTDLAALERTLQSF